MNIEQIKTIKLNFILATARTGSTLLSTMLNTHPNVVSTFEEPFAYNLYPKYKNITKWTSKTIQEFCYDFYLFSEGRLEVQFGTKKDLETQLEKNKEYLTVDTAIKIAYLCFFPNKEKSEITTVVDKQLMFHLYLEKIAKNYPDSKFIILHRDPRDQCLTRFKMLKRKNIHQGYYRIAGAWNFVYGKLLRLKTKIGSNRFLEVKYEDLISNPEIELKKICSFLDITYNNVMLKYDEQINEEVKKTKLDAEILKEFSLFHGGLREKVNTEKIGAWKKDLKTEEANLIWTICGSLAEKIGYTKHENFIRQKIKPTEYLVNFTVYRIRIVTYLYHVFPYFVRYLVKKIKYGKNFKNWVLISKDFYDKNYYNK